MRDDSTARETMSTPPYSVLAAGYDFVMSHVDYELWAEYVHELIMRHHPSAETVLELGCGTGSLAFVLERLGSYRYLATDRSESMIKVARYKKKREEAGVRFDLADFTDFRVDTPVDVIILLYDGINYLMEQEAIRKLMACAFTALKENGVFIVDQSTPTNSINNEAYFEDSDRLDDFSYVRRSRYDPETHIHRTSIEMSVGDRHFREEHLQRAYELGVVRRLAEEAGFSAEAVYDGFSTAPATEASERAHWLLRRPVDDD